MPIRRLFPPSVTRVSDHRASKASPGPDVFTARTTERLVKLAEKLARKVARRWRYADVDELAQIGLLAAVERAGAYDASRGISFEAFVSRRMRGAMNDHCVRASTLAAQHVELEGGERAGEASEGEGDPQIGEGDGDRDADDAEVVMAALEELDELRRALVVAHVVEELPLTECARRVGVAYHRARYALAAGLEELRERVKRRRREEG